MASEYELDAKLGRLLRFAVDVSPDQLDLLCDAAEFWADEAAGEQSKPLQLMEFVGPGT